MENEKALYNYFIPCYRKYMAPHQQYGTRWEGTIPTNIQRISWILIARVYFLWLGVRYDMI